MAQKRKRKKQRGWFKTFLLLLFAPVIIWILAFVIWFNWPKITPLFSDGKGSAKPTLQSAPKIDRLAPATETPQEKILDEDRQKLQEILKERG